MNIWSDIQEAYFSPQSLREKYAYFYGALHRLCTEKVCGLTANYNDFFSRLQAVCRLTNYRLYEIDCFRWRARHIIQGDEEANERTYIFDIEIFFNAFAHFTDTQIPERLKADVRKYIDAYRLEHDNIQVRTQQHKDIYKSGRFIVQCKDENYIYALSRQQPHENLWKIDFSQNEQTTDAAEHVEDGMQLNAISYTFDEKSGVIYPEMIIIDPDYLIDVTSICNCLKEYGDSPLNYLLQKLDPETVTKYTVLGNIAGQFLDDCINEPDITYIESIRKAFMTNLIDISTCDGIDVGFFADCKRQFINIKRTVSQLYADPNFVGVKGNVQLEPSFFCEAFGIQGRFDFLRCDYKTLIEMKSGQWDKLHQTAKKEHLMQMILYKEILYHNLNIHQLSIGGYLLYSRYPMLLEQRTVREMVLQMMRIRNGIVLLERDLKGGKVRDYLQKLDVEELNINKQKSKLWTDYNLPQLNRLLQPVQKADALTIDYFYTFFTFVAREQYLAKVGDGRVESTRGLANLWNADIHTKLQNGDIMIDLSMIQSDSFSVNSPITSITFINTHSEQLTSPNFRVGDPVILYLRNKPADTATTRQVIRCSVESYGKGKITLQLRHPQSNPKLFSEKSLYAIEHDYMDSSMRSLYRGLYSLLVVSKNRRDLILCQRNPIVDISLKLKGKYYSSQIDDIVLKAKQAQDYFLLVGPPGTGKTSLALKSMVNECILDDKSVLLLSYTNRAVDEICETLTGRQYIRIGRELSCDPAYRPHLLNNMAGEDVSRDSLKKLIQNTPILVGTVSSMISAKALFKIKQFDVAIFDEASQILEPQLLGLLCDESNGKLSIKKFIMIGDHKQLPAVVVQDESLSKVESEQLNEIGLTNCRNSLFERLYNQASVNVLVDNASVEESLQNTEVCSQLTLQGRMHPIIADFAGSLFYDGLLLPVGLKHQKEKLPYINYTEEERFVATTRFGFIDIPVPAILKRQPKINISEAKKIANIVVQLQNLAVKNSLPFDASEQIGIIVPFRRQIMAVRQALYEVGIGDADDIMIDTIERYQGSQKDIIIYGTTITQSYELDMLSNITEQEGLPIDRKLNVAVTRARKQLFVLGNRELLSQNELYMKLIEYSVVE